MNQVCIDEFVSLSANCDRTLLRRQYIQDPVRFRSVGECDDESTGLAKRHDRDLAQLSGATSDVLKHGKHAEASGESGEDRICDVAIGFGDKSRKRHWVFLPVM